MQPTTTTTEKTTTAREIHLYARAIMAVAELYSAAERAGDVQRMKHLLAAACSLVESRPNGIVSGVR